jgi:hypothetical protein
LAGLSIALTILVRYLVVMEHQLKSILGYIRMITEDTKYHTIPEPVGERRKLEQVFPRIVMTVTKEYAGHSWDAKGYDVNCTIYRPITASTFLSACATKRNRCRTMFCGANLQPVQPRLHSTDWLKDRYDDERIRTITLEDTGEITGTAVLSDWLGGHEGARRDLIISLNEDNGYCDEETYESLETVVRMIPQPRTDDYGRRPEPYNIKVTGLDIDALECWNTRM